MSYKFNLKKRTNGKFSVRLRSYSLEDRLALGKTENEYVEKTLPDHEWSRYGFFKTMTYEEASSQAKILNAREKVNDVNERRARVRLISDQIHEQLIKSAYLPEFLVTQFEKRLRNESYAEDFEKSKTYSHWKTTMRVIAGIGIDPSDWADNKRAVLKKMEGYAPSTVSKILHLLNAYGGFYSKKMGKYFEKVSMPRGPEVGRISDKYMTKTKGRTKEAKAITLKLMDKIASSDELSVEEKNWCVVCLGFALRPGEVELFNGMDKDKVLLTNKSVKVYQSKLVTLPQKMRFKEVIMSHKFHLDALNLAKKRKQLKKPSLHMLRKVIGVEYGLYSFRKGYTDIMLSLKESIERISLDLGHNSIDRTWRNYRKRILLTDN